MYIHVQTHGGRHYHSLTSRTARSTTPTKGGGNGNTTQTEEGRKQHHQKQRWRKATSLPKSGEETRTIQEGGKSSRGEWDAAPLAGGEGQRHSKETWREQHYPSREMRNAPLQRRNDIRTQGSLNPHIKNELKHL